MFDELLDQSPYIKQRERRAKKQGEIETLQNGVISIVQARFPNRTDLASSQLTKITKAKTLQALFVRIAVATDET